jgi:hypothetical protein
VHFARFLLTEVDYLLGNLTRIEASALANDKYFSDI